MKTIPPKFEGNDAATYKSLMTVLFMCSVHKHKLQLHNVILKHNYTFFRMAISLRIILKTSFAVIEVLRLRKNYASFYFRHAFWKLRTMLWRTTQPYAVHWLKFPHFVWNTHNKYVICLRTCEAFNYAKSNVTLIVFLIFEQL